MTGLGHRGVAAVKWSVVSAGARFILQLMAQVVLARTLGPEIFGIFAIGMVVLTFANFVSGFGFSWSLLQRAELHDEDIRFAMTWQLIAGILTTVVLYFSAPWLAGYFREARAEDVIKWLSLACLLNAAAAPATYLLQRDLNFRAVGLIQVGSYAVGYVCVGMPMALMGWGVSSLVSAWLVQALAQLIASYVLKPHPVRPLLWYSGAGEAITTGRAVFLTNIVNWILNNLDRILIGRFLNAQSLGLYNVAYNLATTPNTLLLGALQPAFLAAGAKLHHEPERLGRVYLEMVATVLVLCLPVFIFLALVSSDLIHFLYGTRWAEAGPVLGILFVSIPAYVLWGLSTPVLWNTRRSHYEFALQLPLVALGILGFYLFAAQGIRSAAVVAGLLLLARALVVGIAAFRALKLPLAAVIPHATRGVVLSAVCAAAAFIGTYTTARFEMPLLSLTVSSLVAMVMCAVLVVLRPQMLGEQATAMLIRFVPRLAGVLHFVAQDPEPEGFGDQP